MNACEAIQASMTLPDFLVRTYLGDLTDSDLMVRAAPGVNHIAWQLGHLISSEHQMVEKTIPGSMPPLPEGFIEQHSRENASSDDPAGFLTKDEYLRLYSEQRAATLAALSKLSDSDLDAPAPESLRQMAPHVAGVFQMQPTHWLMHAGQWAVVRRVLGKPPVI